LSVIVGFLLFVRDVANIKVSNSDHGFLRLPEPKVLGDLAFR